MCVCKGKGGWEDVTPLFTLFLFHFILFSIRGAGGVGDSSRCEMESLSKVAGASCERKLFTTLEGAKVSLENALFTIRHYNFHFRGMRARKYARNVYTPCEAFYSHPTPPPFYFCGYA